MVCTKCEKKLAQLACPDKWKEGASNAGPSRKLGVNKAIGKGKATARFNPYGGSGCKICKDPIHQTGGGMYCHPCAYKKGVCGICGKQVLDTKFYKQSSK